MGDVTQILSQIEDGDGKAADRLMPLVYDELRRLAADKMAHEDPGQTLQATALVHEAYVRLVDVDRVQHWKSRGDFFAAAAQAMRHLLVENARRKQRVKRGGRLHRTSLDDNPGECKLPPAELVALDDALTKLASEDPERAKLVQLRFFAGLNHEEAARVLGVSVRTAKRHWRYARAWLRREMRRGGDSGISE